MPVFLSSLGAAPFGLEGAVFDFSAGAPGSAFEPGSSPSSPIFFPLGHGIGCERCRVQALLGACLGCSSDFVVVLPMFVPANASGFGITIGRFARS